MTLINERNRRGHQIVTVWHPDAKGDPFETRFGCVRAERGQPAYQLTTGEVVRV